MPGPALLDLSYRTRLQLWGIEEDMSVVEVHKRLSRYGKILEVELRAEHAFVEYALSEDAEAAMSCLRLASPFGPQVSAAWAGGEGRSSVAGKSIAAEMGTENTSNTSNSTKKDPEETHLPAKQGKPKGAERPETKATPEDAMNVDNADKSTSSNNSTKTDTSITKEIADGVQRLGFHSVEKPRTARGYNTQGYHAVEVTDLPSAVRWQELKDFGRSAGVHVSFCDVIMKPPPPVGLIWYESREDARRAARKLDHQTLRGEVVRVLPCLVRQRPPQGPRKQDENDVSMPGRGHKRARTKSKSASRSQSRSRSRSPPRRRDVLPDTGNRMGPSSFKYRSRTRTPPSQRKRPRTSGLLRGDE